MLKLTVPYQYSISYIPYRHQNTQSALGLSFTDVEFREVATESLHRVARVKALGRNLDGEYASDRFDFKDRPAADLVTFEGAFWLESGLSFEEMSAKLVAHAPAEMTPFEGVRKWHPMGQRPYSTLAEETRRNPGARQWSESMGKVAQELKEVARRTIVAGGKVFERVREPTLRAEIAYDGSVVVGIGGFERGYVMSQDQLVGSWSSMSRKKLPVGLRRDRLDRLDALLQRLADAGHQDIGMQCEVQVEDASAFRASALVEQAGMLAEAISKGLGEVMTDLPEARLLAAMDLREAVDRAGSAVTPAVRAALRTLADTVALSGADAFRHRFRRKEASEAFDLAVVWAKDCLDAIASEVPGYDRDHEIRDDAVVRIVGTRTSIQEIRSPGVLLDMSMETEMELADLEACVSDGGRVHAIVEPGTYPRGEHEYKGFLMTDAAGEIVQAHAAPDLAPEVLEQARHALPVQHDHEGGPRP